MAGVNIPIGSPLAAKVFGAAVFAGVQTAPGFMNLLSGGAPQMGDAVKKLKGQTSADYPIVKVTDLKQSAGDRVSVDLFNIFQGKPIMGDRRLEGRGMNTTSSTQEVSINRSRGMADTGGKMTQKRTKHNLRTVITAGLTGWAQRLEDQRCLVALSGARGSQNTADWVVPLQTDTEFSEIMVNPVQAPTFNRRFFAMYTGTGITPPTTIANLTTNGYLTLSEVDAIGAILKESQVPLQSVKIKGDEYSWNSPMWVMFVTERQWAIMKGIAGSKWVSAVQQAVKRFEGQRHPLFMGDSIMWNGILVKPMNRYAIRFKAGEAVYENSSANAESAVAAGVDADRAIILGAQALIKAYGNEESSDYHYAWNEELVDHKSAVEVSLSMMEGTAKTRFTINGALTDHGVAVVDSYAPAIGTAAFNTVIANSIGKS
ncbi:N4-gp56 family major capsid protein [Methylomicrobium agile]|uniref:N4-gp56 family major capsid protein n=1 Tax=Methylomicrobium agile TaxID=39774 RepID=UPI000A0071A8|nr:N4-gp56 family major capsid protein [Methylomicrobium agile]